MGKRIFSVLYWDNDMNIARVYEMDDKNFPDFISLVNEVNREISTPDDIVDFLKEKAVLLEKPVISTDVGDISSIIKHNVNGIIVKPGNIEQLTDAIIRILDESTYNQFISGVKKEKTIILSDRTDFQILEKVIDN